MPYGSFQDDTGVNLPTYGIDPDHLSPDKQRQRLLGAMLTAHARNMAESERQTTAPPDISMGQDTLDSMVKSDPVNTQPMNTDKVQQAFKDPNEGVGPNVTLSHAVLGEQPATKYVDQAQGQLDDYKKGTHGWRGLIAPGLLAAGSVLGAHSYNGQHLQDEATQDMNTMISDRRQKEQSLVNQVQSARTLQQQEYEADQRNRQQDVVTAGNNQTKTLMAHIMAGSRENVATTQAQAKDYTADQNLSGRRYTADAGLEGRKYAADQGAQSRVSAARINADAALNRFLAGQDREDARQQRGFAHTDLKPTTDEDRRADLARAGQGYATRLMELAQQRPDLWGGLGQGAYFLGGRGTTLRNMVGSSDPDVAEMKYLREQIGITQMGAHSVRSAQAIGPIADSIVNSFNTAPEAAVSTLQHAIEQLNTFTGVQTRPGVQGPQGAPTSTLTGKVKGAAPAPAVEEPRVSPRGQTSFKVTGKTATSWQTAQPGDIYNGHVYLGGDKKSPENWAEYHQGGGK
jgi:hypothetical protein